MKRIPHTKRIYRAGASSDIVRAESDIKKLMAAGWTITFDWTVPVRNAGSASPDDLVVRKEAALADLEGVWAADVLWLAQPDASSTSTGAWVELGYALAMRDRRRLTHAPEYVPTIVVSGSSRKCIFADLCDYRFESHDDAFDFIVKELGR